MKPSIECLIEENARIKAANRRLLADITDLLIENAHLRAELLKMKDKEVTNHDGI